MTKYITQELARYWPVSSELMAQYKDGTHTGKYDGTLEWRNKNGKWHRDGDKPAYIGVDGTLWWYQNGLLHRDLDKPAQIWSDGRLIWCQNGLRHRNGDKPAEIWADGTVVWRQNDQRHRFCGPAVIDLDGETQWWINEENITQEVNEWLAEEEWLGTPTQIFEFQLRFG